MMMKGYDHIYLNKVSRSVGNMLHDAVFEFGYDGNDFLKLFIQSGIAEEIENGNPKYIAGKSGLELFSDVVEITSGKKVDVQSVESYDRSDVYWVGWVLTHYQWYSQKSFRAILEVIPYDELLCLYDTMHEADIQKSYETFDTMFIEAPSKLQTIRKQCGLTQEELASLTGISLSTIRSYERKAKNINKAAIETLVTLSQVLKCNIVDLLD